MRWGGWWLDLLDLSGGGSVEVLSAERRVKEMDANASCEIEQRVRGNGKCCLM